MDGGTAEQQPSSDVCSYSIHLLLKTSTSTKRNGNVDDDNDAAAAADLLQATCAAILAYVDTLCREPSTSKPYIWQRDAFSLSPSPSSSSSSDSESSNVLRGDTTFGESVEDEWFIVYLLREISRHFPDTAIQVQDNDGQFLLIEAAEALPNWINPDNAENRLWIYGGELHLVPLSVASPPPQTAAANGEKAPAGFLNAADALRTIADTSIDTRAPDSISQAVWARTAHLPHGIKQGWHTTVVQLPLGVAELLAQDETLISRAVQAFYERDALQLKACQYMKRFPPSPSKLASVRMTKALYAQLASQRFYPPRIFERSGWKLAAEDSEASTAGATGQADAMDTTSSGDARPSDRKYVRRAEIGMKIACGFEILYAESAGSRRGTRRTRLDLHSGSTPGKNLRDQSTSASAPSSQNTAYLKYVVALTKAGYFEGEVPGSRKYAELEGKADEYWSGMDAVGGTSDESGRGRGTGARVADRIDALLAPFEAEQADKTRTLARELHRSATAAGADAGQDRSDLVEDDDAWLYIDEARLDEMLKAKQRPSRVDESDAAMQEDGADGQEEEGDEDEKMANHEAARLQAMADKFEAFVGGQGSMEGAMFDDDEFSDGDDEDDDVDEDGLGADVEDLVAGSARGTKRKMTEEEREERMHTLVPGLQDGQWGAENAQKEKASAAASRSPAAGVATLPEIAKRSDTVMPVAAHDQAAQVGSAQTATARAAAEKTAKASLASDRLTQSGKLDGVSDSSDSDGEGEEGAPRLDPFMGAPASGASHASLLELDDEEDEDDGDERPQVMEDDDAIDFGDGEMEEFLKFTRDALGLTEAQYGDIVESRKQRGAFVPAASPAIKQPNASSKSPVPVPTSKKPTAFSSSKTADAARSQPAAAPAGARNPNLDSFEALMEAMDAQLQSQRSASATGQRMATKEENRKPVRRSAEGIEISDDEDEGDDTDDMAALDAELAAALKGGAAAGGEGGMDYQMISNFLESFKAQNGLAGPVSNVFSRLDKDFKMPRDG